MERGSIGHQFSRSPFIRIVITAMNFFSHNIHSSSSFVMKISTLYYSIYRVISESADSKHC